MTKRHQKNIRLPAPIYQNPSYIFSITICTEQRIQIFRNAIYAKAITDTFHTAYFTDNAMLYAYCLMPDHLHLLISPRKTNLIKIINRWKSYTANQLRKCGLSSKCWQHRFYDHALRKEEDIKSTAEYIINNPIRAGIVSNWYNYEYSWHKLML